jgi:hypothetical protein
VDALVIHLDGSADLNSGSFHSIVGMIVKEFNATFFTFPTLDAFGFTILYCMVRTTNLTLNSLERY